MANFTKIGETDQSFISIDTKNKISKINDNVYSGFTE